MSHLMPCDDARLHVDRSGYANPCLANPCRCQLFQTQGGIYLTVTIEDSMKKKNLNFNCDNDVIAGLLHVVKLPHLNALTCHQLNTTDLAFKLRRKKFTIEVHLVFMCFYKISICISVSIGTLSCFKLYFIIY